MWVVNSSVKGYLGPTTTVLEDAALDDFLHDFIAGITNIDNKLVRPNWEQMPANMPAIDESWIAFGITDRKDDPTVFKTWDPLIGETIYRNQILEILISFYGPNANYIQGLFRDGINITQNRDILIENNYAIVKLSNPRNASLKINTKWQKRIDVILTMRREINRVYPILDITSGQADLITEAVTHIVVNQ